MSNNIISLKNVSKEYKLGAIGGTTLKEEFQRIGAKILKRDDPTRKLDEGNIEIGSKFLALNNISFNVNNGETLGIIGHNGAGKSTLLKLLSRVTTPTNGDIYINGRIASMLEVGTGFHPELTGIENIYMNGAILGMSSKEITKKLNEIIEFSECEKFIDTPVKRYSSGMYVKLAFSVAAHLDSEILVMDEVLAVGDMKFQQKCLGRMDNAAQQEGRTVLYVSHNMNTIRQLCSRCLVLDHGKLIFDGNVEEAIQLYMSKNDFTFCKEIDFSTKKHLPFCSNKIVFKNAIIKSDNNIYSQEDFIECSFELNSIDNITDVRFMFILFYRDGTRIGKSESNNFNVDKGNNNINIKYYCKNLADGDYYFEIDILKRNDLGSYEKYDGIPEVFPFKIANNSVFGVMGDTWKPNYWGHILLPPIEII